MTIYLALLYSHYSSLDSMVQEADLTTQLLYLERRRRKALNFLDQSSHAKLPGKGGNREDFQAFSSSQLLLEMVHLVL